MKYDLSNIDTLIDKGYTTMKIADKIGCSYEYIKQHVNPTQKEKLLVNGKIFGKASKIYFNSSTKKFDSRL